MVKIEDFVIPSANLGVENPLPSLQKGNWNMCNVDPKLSEEDKEFVNKGMVYSVLPYTIQNNYDRNIHDKVYKAAVLENKYIKAVFIPELGGRLWSLYDKVAEREILYRNKVFQPAHLALRNAWFSGGVEFNFGIHGHHTHTCSPMFVRIGTTKDGEEAVQIYEYERVRGVAFGITAYLPEDSKVLYIKGHAENLSDKDTFGYWWSNGAIRETDGTRVIVPTDETFIGAYVDGSHRLTIKPVPEIDGVDTSYPARNDRAIDYFYKIPKKAPERWEAAVEKNGVGSLQVSTNELWGRKLFVWGDTIGGHHWSEYLGSEGDRYAETQAGYNYTQFEHTPMAPGECWSWTEGYSAIECDPSKAHGTWEEAKAEVSRYVHELYETDDINKKLENIVPTEFESFRDIRYGTGFGALEELIGGKKLSKTFDFYPESMNELQAPWNQLLTKGYIDPVDVNTPTYTFVSGEKWVDLLEKSLDKPEGKHWYTYYQLGVAYWTVKEFEKSEKAFRTSIELTPNPWAYYCVSRLEEDAENIDAAVEYMKKATEFDTNCVNLYIEYAKLLNRSGNGRTLVESFASFPDIAKNRSRIRLELAKAHIALKEYDEAASIVTSDFILPDVQEGEVSLSSTWFDLYLNIVKRDNPNLSDEEAEALRQELYPLPKQLDFRMSKAGKK